MAAAAAAVAAGAEFGNLKSDSGLEKLNAYLCTRSYITGYAPTQDDAITYAKLLGMPNKSKYMHAYRWYKHISHFSTIEKASWPKGAIKQDAKQQQAAKAKEDEDFDLFGDDGGKDKGKEDVKKLSESKKQEAAGAADGKKEKKKVVSKSSLVIEVKPASIDTDLDEVARLCKEIKIEGVTWGQAVKKIPVAFGLFKLQLCCTILDDVVNTSDITDQIEALGMNEEQREKLRKRHEGEDDEDDEDEEDEDEEQGGLVQSAEIVSFNKL